MVKPPDVFPNYRIRELWKGSQAGAPKWWSRQWRVCSRRGLGCTFVARASGCTYMVEPLPCAMVWCHCSRGSVSCKSYLWPFPFPLPLPFPAPFPKPLTDPFSEPWSEPFSEPFSEPLGVNFPFAPSSSEILFLRVPRYRLTPVDCFNISFGCCRHSVSNTFVQLTEGRSARDQPKQPPAKKITPVDCFLSFCHRQSSLLAILALHQFWTYRLLPPTASV